MKWTRVIAVLLGACLFRSIDGFAADQSELRALIDAGQYRQAILIADGTQDLHNKLLIAEAINTRILLSQSDNPKRDAEQAMKLAKEVVNASPKLSEASIHYAISLGFYGRTLSLFSAFRKNIPMQIKDAITAAETANPDNGLVHALWGAWHFSVAEKAGAKTAQKRYGANVTDGMTAFEHALAYAPDDLLTVVNYVYMLHAAEIDTAAARKEYLIKHALKIAPKNAAEKTLQAHFRTFAAPSMPTKEKMKHAKSFLQW